MYTVFSRKWWKKNPKWPNGLEPDGNARRTIIREDVKTIEEARQICKEWNEQNPEGKYSRRAEFTSNY